MIHSLRIFGLGLGMEMSLDGLVNTTGKTT